jgi:hypothetical protein
MKGRGVSFSFFFFFHHLYPIINMSDYSSFGAAPELVKYKDKPRTI